MASDAWSTQFPDSEGVRSTIGRGRRPQRGLLQRLAERLKRQRAVPPVRSASQMSTLPPPSRGQALREAHRTLAQRLASHPHIRQVLPHLAAIERSLAKRGSRALLRLQVPVLQRGLEQLALLQRDDESPADAANLRVLRLRLMEAIAVRSGRPGQGRNSRLPRRGQVEPGFADGDLLRELRIPAAEALDGSVSDFTAAEREWGSPGDSIGAGADSRAPRLKRRG